MKPASNPFLAASTAVLSLVVYLAPSASAQTWTSATTGGTWSTAGNWTPASVPITGNTALLDNATASRIVIYDAAASGALGTLNFTQTSAVTNQLTVLRNLTVANAITLGATGGGSAELQIGDPALATTTYTLTATGGINVNSGGLLVLQSSGTSNQYQALVGGNVTVAGGTLKMTALNIVSTSQSYISGVLAMSSGNITMSDSGTPTSGLRLTAGSFNLTGGTVTSGQTGNLLWATGSNATNTIGSGVTLSAGSFGFGIVANGTGNTWNLDAAGAAGVAFTARNNNNIANMTNTLQSSSVGGTASVYYLQYGVSGTNISANKLVLGSNVTATTYSGQVIAESNGSGVNGIDSYALDLNGFTFNGTTSTAIWRPNTLTTGTGTTSWAFNSTTAGGVMKVQQLDLSATNVTTHIGAGVTLQATGGNSSVITLSGTGTINAGSTLLYSGTATTGSPALLTSNRTLGNLNVSSGALKVSGSSITAAGLVTVGTGATLDLSAFGLTANGLTVNNGLVNTPANLTITGTGAAVLKTGASTLSLLNANTYTGNTTISGGILNLGVAENANVAGPLGKQLANAAGTVLMTTGGILQFSASNAFDYSGRFSTAGSQTWNIDTNGQSVSFATALQGTGSTLTKSGAGTLTVSASNTYDGATQISAGTLVASSIVVSGGASSLGNATSAVVLGDAANKGTLSYTGNSATYTRGFTVNAGQGEVDVTTAGQTLTISTGDITGTGAVTLGGATTSSTSSIIVNSNISTTVKQSTGSLTLNGVLSGAATQLVYGGGPTTTSTVTLTNANNSFAGGVNGMNGWAHLTANATTVFANTGSNSALGSGGLITINNRALNLTGFTAPQSTDRAWNVGSLNALALNNNGGNTLTLTGNITNNIFAGKWNLGGTYTAGTNEIRGVISDGSAVLAINIVAGKWLLSGNNTYTGTTTVNSAGVLRFGKAASLYNGNTANWTAANVKVASNATLALNVDSAGTNGFTASDVTTLLGNLGGANGTSSTGFASGAIIAFDTTSASANTFTVSDTIANSTGTGGGAIGLTKLGTATLLLSGTNSYSGATTITAGTLSVTGSTAAGSAVSVAAGATLSGSGTIHGNVTAAGTIAPGNGASTLTTGAATLTGTLAVKINGSTTDLLAVNGALTLSAGATLAITAVSPTASSYTIATYTGTTPAFTTVTGLPAGFAIAYSATDIKLIAPLGNYASWALTHGVTGGPNGDSDNDGIPNLVEYALALNPSGSDGAAGTFVGNTVTFNKRAEAVTNGDVSYVIEKSTDLGIADPWTAVTPDTDSPTQISYTLPGGSVKNFTRLQVIQH